MTDVDIGHASSINTFLESSEAINYITEVLTREQLFGRSINFKNMVNIHNITLGIVNNYPTKWEGDHQKNVFYNALQIVIDEIIKKPLLGRATSCKHSDVADFVAYLLGSTHICVNEKKGGSWYEFDTKINYWKEKTAGQMKSTLSHEVVRIIEDIRHETYDASRESEDEGEIDRLQNTCKKYDELMGKLKMQPFQNSILQELCPLLLVKDFEAKLNTKTYCLPVGDGMMVEINSFTGEITHRKGLPSDGYNRGIKTSYVPNGPTDIIMKLMSELCFTVDTINSKDDEEQNEYKYYPVECITGGRLDEKTGYIIRDEESKYGPIKATYTPAKYENGRATHYFRSVPDLGKIKLFKQMLGTSIIGRNLVKCIHVIVGRKDSGKSFLFEQIRSLFGDDFSGVAPKGAFFSCATEGAGAHTAHLNALIGKRFVVFPEGSSNYKLNSEQVKCLRGNDKIANRKLNQEFGNFFAMFTAFVHTNAPFKMDPDPVTRSAVLHLKFNSAFKPEPDYKDPYQRKLDHNLTEYKSEEFFKQLLTFIVEGASEVVRNKHYDVPPEILVINDEIHDRSNPYSSFLNEMAHKSTIHTKRSSGRYGVKSRWKVKECHKAYSDWHYNNLVKGITDGKPDDFKLFRSIMKDIFEIEQVRKVDHFSGICPKEEVALHELSHT